MSERQWAPSAQRNRGPILEVLRGALPARGAVLEIASGTGEHVVAFAAALDGLDFQPSDPDPAARASISAWIADSGLAKVRPPLALDADGDWDLPDDIAASIVAVLCINMVHISPWRATLGLMRGAARALREGGLLYLYGAYRRGARHTAPSNEAFDASLRRQNPEWGVRNLEAVAAAGEAQGLGLEQVIEMPANNLSVLFRRRAALRPIQDPA